MERSGKRPVILATLLLPWLGHAPCRGQMPIPPPLLARPAASSARPCQAPAAPSTEDPASRRLDQSLPQAVPLPPTGPIPTPASDDLGVKLQPAPLEPSDIPLPINLATALRLSDARPLIVAAAQAGVWVAEAQLTRANVLWIPRLNIGFDYIRHDGGGPDFNKGILTAPSVNYFYGGAGMDQYVASTDAIFEPLAARQVLNSRQWDIQAAKNDALLQTAEAYFSVHRDRGMFTGALYAVERGRDLVERVASLTRDLVPRDELDRARTMLADLEQQATSHREAWRVHSADLTQVLRLDPRAVIVPTEPDHLQITLIDPARPLDELTPIGLLNRPELASHRALVLAAEARLRREKMRPLLPSVMINGFQASGGMLLQAGVFGIGPNSSLNQWTGRADQSVQLVWQLEAFGMGNLARIKKQRGAQSESIIELAKTQDRIAAEVTEARARLQSAAARVGQADRSLRAAVIAFNGNYDGLKQTTRFGDVLTLVNRPGEVVFALRLMKMSFDEYFSTVADYNRAQFQLFHALGYPAREIAESRSPGAIEAVDLSRPAYLPPVGNGPPPATR